MLPVPGGWEDSFAADRSRPTSPLRGLLGKRGRASRQFRPGYTFTKILRRYIQ